MYVPKLIYKICIHGAGKGGRKKGGREEWRGRDGEGGGKGGMEREGGTDGWTNGGREGERRRRGVGAHCHTLAEPQPTLDTLLFLIAPGGGKGSSRDEGAQRGVGSGVGLWEPDCTGMEAQE